MPKQTNPSAAAAETEVATSPALAVADPAQDKPEFTAAEKREYVVALIKKQAGVSAGEAVKRAADLAADVHDKLHDAGREGRVVDCRALLGL